MTDQNFQEHVDGMFNFFLPRDTKVHQWILNQTEEQRGRLVRRSKNFKHIPPSFIFFVIFIYGDNQTTRKHLSDFQRRFIKLGDENRWGDVDLAFDLNVFFQTQMLESTNPKNEEKKLTVWFINTTRKLKMSKNLPLTAKKKKEVILKRKTDCIVMSNVLEESKPSIPKWNVREILARQTKFAVQ